jgi:hypothetical protein
MNDLTPENAARSLGDLQRAVEQMIQTPWRCREAGCDQRYPGLDDLIAHQETHTAAPLTGGSEGGSSDPTNS